MTADLLFSIVVAVTASLLAGVSLTLMRRSLLSRSLDRDTRALIDIVSTQVKEVGDITLDVKSVLLELNAIEGGFSNVPQHTKDRLLEIIRQQEVQLAKHAELDARLESLAARLPEDIRKPLTDRMQNGDLAYETLAQSVRRLKAAIVEVPDGGSAAQESKK